MAVNKVHKFQSLNHMTLFLNGGIVAGPVGAQGIPNLVGKMLRFTLPAAAEHTFVVGAGVSGDPYTLTLLEIKTQLEAAVAGLRVSMIDGRLVLQETAPSGGVVIIQSTVPASDARAAIGLDAASTITSKVYTPAQVTPVAPCWVAIQADDNSIHTVYTWE